jgi:hypothetical protein
MSAPLFARPAVPSPRRRHPDTRGGAPCDRELRAPHGPNMGITDAESEFAVAELNVILHPARVWDRFALRGK